jgi:beta-lactam-binding protein with PASTA domain
MVQVPDLTGMQVDQATSELQRLGFQVQVFGVSGGTVYYEQPTGQAPKGSSILLVAGP